jgi:F5/8 type C domain-containing protein
MARGVGVALPVLLALAGCTVVAPSTAPPSSTPASPSAITSTAPATDGPTPVGSIPSASAALGEPPPHLIGVRQAAGHGELYDVATGQPFIARGVNLLRLEQFGPNLYDTLFGARYDAAWVDAKLAALAGLGYNTVRVFLDLCKDDCIALSAGGLSPAYLDHVADFLGRTRAHGIFVVPTSNDLPDTGDYGLAPPCCTPFGGYRNSHYLSPAGHAAAERYWTDIVGGLLERGAATDAVLAWELVNEQFVLTDAPPLSLAAGLVETADGQAWDMASGQQRKDMVESNFVAFADRLRTAIRRLDPSALVTVGYFAPNEPIVWRPGDNRLVLTRAVLERSTLDLVDLHAYPGGSLNVADHLTQYGASADVAKPLLMGEMGAFKFQYATPAAGAAGLVGWQVESCHQFSGWLLWREADADVEVWGGSQDGAVIDNALSPQARPDPCDPGLLMPTNLAANGSVRASNETADSPASNAIDGAPGTVWIAGAGPPQWIEIDLGQPSDVASIELVVAQSPSGPTRHRILVGARRTDLREVAFLRGPTADGQTLTVDVNAELGRAVRFVRVETSVSPSWVAWREIRVYGR